MLKFLLQFLHCNFFFFFFLTGLNFLDFLSRTKLYTSLLSFLNKRSLFVSSVINKGSLRYMQSPGIFQSSIRFPTFLWGRTIYPFLLFLQMFLLLQLFQICHDSLSNERVSKWGFRSTFFFTHERTVSTFFRFDAQSLL